MKENMRLAFQGIWLHKMRSFLTMLGIVIGIAAIIAIVSTIKGTNEQIKQNLIGSGNNIVEVTLTQDGGTYDMEYGGQDISSIPLVSDDTLKKIRELDTVEDAATYVSRTYTSGVYYQNTSLDGASVYGVSDNYMEICGYRVVRGRGFAERDYEGNKKVVLIDDNSVSALFQNENPVGKTLEIKGEPFTVIGIVEESGSTQVNISSLDDYYMYASDSYGKVFMPESSWSIVYQYDEQQSVAVKATSTDDMSTAGQQAENILNNTFENKEVTYSAVDIMETVKNLQDLSEGTNRQLLWIASISLLVGGIGVMNIMLVSVTERTREIGLKKAIGARKKRILLQFLTEAATLGSLGGILGVISGIILAEVISTISGTPVAISIPSIIISVVFSMVIGVIFGLIPSIKAANLNPIEALRRE
jgi:putative ABC transport system permease protein